MIVEHSHFASWIRGLLVTIAAGALTQPTAAREHTTAPAHPRFSHPSSSGPQQETDRKTLAAARMLADHSDVDLPIAFASVLPDGASQRVDESIVPRPEVERQTLKAALLLAGPDVAVLPIELAPVLPDDASRGAEGWTVPGSNGMGERIYIYTASEIFRCAIKGEDPQCLLRLASTIVHEAWHFRSGPREDRAYAAQILFLKANRASSEQVEAVLISRNRALAAERKAIAAVKGRSGQ